jgi:hypothetical protein
VHDLFPADGMCCVGLGGLTDMDDLLAPAGPTVSVTVAPTSPTLREGSAAGLAFGSFSAMGCTLGLTNFSLPLTDAT